MEEGEITYELIGKLLEASLIMQCDVFKLVEIFANIQKRGYTEPDRVELLNIGFPATKDVSPVELIDKILNQEPIVVMGYVNSYQYKFCKSKEDLINTVILKN